MCRKPRLRIVNKGDNSRTLKFMIRQNDITTTEEKMAASLGSRNCFRIAATLPKTNSLLYSTSELPDYGKTTVNIHEHKLKRPDKAPPPALARRWTGLEGLKERTMGSLIPETLEQLEKDKEFQITVANLKRLGQKQITREEWKKRQEALDRIDVKSFMQFTRRQRTQSSAEVSDCEKILRKRDVNIMLLNIGLYCNQACNHCHVESSPKRQEMMSRDVVDRCLKILEASPGIETVDITGGAPELCDEFRYLVQGARALGRHVIDRCNLTSLLEPGQEDTADFLAENSVRVIASLPCYSAKNVNLQRGKGVFDKSIQGLLLLNSLGYGKENSDLTLDLIYNPLGGFLPPPQAELKAKYKEELFDVFGIEFNELFTATNMPVKRFFDFLYRRNELADYMELLVRNFNLATVDKVMCLDYLSVSWDGTVFDCDYNQQIDLPILQSLDRTSTGTLTGPVRQRKAATVWDITSAADLKGSRIVVDNHCFACTAGMGSS